MKLSKLIPGDTFKTDSGVKFQVLKMKESEIKLYKNQFKVLRIDTGVIYYLGNIIIRKL